MSDETKTGLLVGGAALALWLWWRSRTPSGATNQIQKGQNRELDVAQSVNESEIEYFGGQDGSAFQRQYLDCARRLPLSALTDSDFELAQNLLAGHLDRSPQRYSAFWKRAQAEVEHANDTETAAEVTGFLVNTLIKIILPIAGMVTHYATDEGVQTAKDYVEQLQKGFGSSGKVLTEVGYMLLSGEHKDGTKATIGDLIPNADATLSNQIYDGLSDHAQWVDQSSHGVMQSFDGGLSTLAPIGERADGLFWRLCLCTKYGPLLPWMSPDIGFSTEAPPGGTFNASKRRSNIVARLLRAIDVLACMAKPAELVPKADPTKATDAYRRVHGSLEYNFFGQLQPSYYEAHGVRGNYYVNPIFGKMFGSAFDPIVGEDALYVDESGVRYSVKGVPDQKHSTSAIFENIPKEVGDIARTDAQGNYHPVQTGTTTQGEFKTGAPPTAVTVKQAIAGQAATQPKQATAAVVPPKPAPTTPPKPAPPKKLIFSGARRNAYR
jgi:hypothetical protein